MNLVPDWAPNIHPLLVHFPIALLSAAVAVDVVGWAFRRNKPLRQFGHAAVRAGHGGRGRGVCDRPRGVADHLAAGNGAGRPRGALGLGVAHGLVLRALSPWLAWCSCALRGAIPVRRSSRRSPWWDSSGSVCSFETGDRGGRLVYQHGVGTARE